MKKFSLIFLSSLIILFACNKKDDEEPTETLVPTKTQWGFALNYTATWCGPCGAWGAPLIHEFEEAGNVVAITAHSTGDPMYIAALYNSFENIRTSGGGIPSFWVGDIKTTAVGSMENLLAQTAIAGIALNSTMGSGTMTVKTKSEFFEDSPGDYYLVVLILESGIDGSGSAGDYAQNGTAAPATYKHDFVLRASSGNNNVYGEVIATDPAKGETISKDFTITIDPSWDNEVYAVAILWKKDSSSIPKYKFINAVK